MTEILEYCDKHIEITIQKDTTVINKYYTVLQNLYKDYHSTKVIYGGTEQIVKNKCIRQLKQWRKEIEENGN